MGYRIPGRWYCAAVRQGRSQIISHLRAATALLPYGPAKRASSFQGTFIPFEFLTGKDEAMYHPRSDSALDSALDSDSDCPP